MRVSPTRSTVIPFRNLPRSFERRRPLASLAGHVTCLMLFLHAETDTHIQVSEDDDAVGAVWLSKALLTINRSYGRFLVVTLSQKLADQHRFSTPILDRQPYTSEERADLKAAIEIAYRERVRFSGRQDRLPYMGRNAFA